MRVLALVVIVLCALPFRVEAHTPLLAQAKAAFERDIPGFRFDERETSFGDFNGDGITDFATFVGYHGYTEDENNHPEAGLKVAVFLGGKDDTFNLYGVSSDIFMHMHVSFNLKVKKQSVYLSRSGVDGAYSWEEAFQFKICEGRMSLVGLEKGRHTMFDLPKDDYGTSTNLITGRVIRWHETGKKRKESATILPALKTVPFEDFNYNDFTEKWGSSLF
jgi:hypothetical protein